MRKVIPPAAALVLAAVMVLAGGRMMERRGFVEPLAVDEPGTDELAVSQDVVASTAGDGAVMPAAPGASPAPQDSDAQPRADQGQSQQIDSGAEALAAVPTTERLLPRFVAPGTVAPPQLTGDGLQRQPPREPLSQLGLALPPPPEPRNPWAGKPLFRPVAVESAVFESGGHKIAIAGVKSIPVEESCTHEGTSWPCGVRARAAFRLWLRGRALVCQIPESEEDQSVMQGTCRLAKQDVGAWLVENGWALAAPDGPYVQAGEKAREAKLGIFGAPPDTSAVPAVPDGPAAEAVELQPIMTEDGVDPAPAADPRMAFPPPPQP